MPIPSGILKNANSASRKSMLSKLGKQILLGYPPLELHSVCRFSISHKVWLDLLPF